MDYNTSREKLEMREYGRNIVSMVEQIKKIEDRAKRTEQAKAVVKAMELLNPSVRSQEDYQHKLWDHLHIIAGFDLDIDAPYPAPAKEDFETRPVPIPMKDTKIKATHYGRNIEKMIDLLCNEPDETVKSGLFRALAIYMRQQYLIWNKDNVADETIFNDIVKLSDGRLTVPEGIELDKISSSATFSRPGIGGGTGVKKNNNFKNHRKGGKKR